MLPLNESIYNLSAIVPFSSDSVRYSLIWGLPLFAITRYLNLSSYSLAQTRLLRRPPGQPTAGGNRPAAGSTGLHGQMVRHLANIAKLPRSRSGVLNICLRLRPWSPGFHASAAVKLPVRPTSTSRCAPRSRPREDWCENRIDMCIRTTSSIYLWKLMFFSFFPNIWYLGIHSCTTDKLPSMSEIILICSTVCWCWPWIYPICVLWCTNRYWRV